MTQTVWTTSCCWKLLRKTCHFLSIIMSIFNTQEVFQFLWIISCLKNFKSLESDVYKSIFYENTVHPVCLWYIINFLLWYFILCMKLCPVWFMLELWLVNDICKQHNDTLHYTIISQNIWEYLTTHLPLNTQHNNFLRIIWCS